MERMIDLLTCLLVITMLSMILLACNSPRAYVTWTDLPTPEQMETKTIDSICGNEDLLYYLESWERNAAQKYSDFILILAHGAVVEGQLFLFPDYEPPILAKDVIAEARSVYGEDRLVILVACNELKATIDVPNTVYFRNTVWALPDTHLSEAQNRKRDTPQNLIGDISEATRNLGT